MPRHPPNALLTLDLQRILMRRPKPTLEHYIAVQMPYQPEDRPVHLHALRLVIYDVKEKVF